MNVAVPVKIFFIEARLVRQLGSFDEQEMDSSNFMPCILSRSVTPRYCDSKYKMFLKDVLEDCKERNSGKNHTNNT